MDFIHSPLTSHDPRDSDLGELPDAPDASIGNAPMLLTVASPFIAILIGLVLAWVAK